jgi:ribosomal protein S18 acetylase RimI-like enzyme
MGFSWWAWKPSLISIHALVKQEAFADQPDSVLFPNLRSYEGCHDLMCAIAERKDFCPAATWLLVRKDAVIGTIQGLVNRKLGAIQNVGIIPAFRGLGMGEWLVRRCIAGFYASGARVLSLEVTASNEPALKLYRRLGFRSVATTYKPDPNQPPEPVHSDELTIGAGI